MTMTSQSDNFPCFIYCRYNDDDDTTSTFGQEKTTTTTTTIKSLNDNIETKYDWKDVVTYLFERNKKDKEIEKDKEDKNSKYILLKGIITTPIGLEFCCDDDNIPPFPTVGSSSMDPNNANVQWITNWILFVGAQDKLVPVNARLQHSDDKNEGIIDEKLKTLECRVINELKEFKCKIMVIL